VHISSPFLYFLPLLLSAVLHSLFLSSATSARQQSGSHFNPLLKIYAMFLNTSSAHPAIVSILASENPGSSQHAGIRVPVTPAMSTDLATFANELLNASLKNSLFIQRLVISRQAIFAYS